MRTLFLQDRLYLSSAMRCSGGLQAPLHAPYVASQQQGRRGSSRASPSGRATPARCACDQPATAPTDTQLASVSRRAAIFAAMAAAAGVFQAPQTAQALPLAPLGNVVHVGGDKLVGLPIEQVKDILARDLREGQYFVTGDLTLEVFADDCRFKDPTNDVVGLSRYKQALGILFDPRYSVVRLRDIQVTGPRQIEADWVLGGYLKFPWNPRVEPFEGHTVYTLNERGLIQIQDQTWTKSAATALRESFTPTGGPQTDIVQIQ